MIQVLPIDFQFKRQTYSALASIMKCDNDFAVSIQFDTNALSHIIPEDELFFKLHNGLLRASRSSEKQQLIQCVREAIFKKLNVWAAYP